MVNQPIGGDGNKITELRFMACEPTDLSDTDTRVYYTNADGKFVDEYFGGYTTLNIKPDSSFIIQFSAKTLKDYINNNPTKPYFNILCFHNNAGIPFMTDLFTQRVGE